MSFNYLDTLVRGPLFVPLMLEVGLASTPEALLSLSSEESLVIAISLFFFIVLTFKSTSLKNVIY